MTTPAPCRCPYCGEPIELMVDDVGDGSAGIQHSIEDCPVCCRPIQLRIGVDARGVATLELSREDDA